MVESVTGRDNVHQRAGACRDSDAVNTHASAKTHPRSLPVMKESSHRGALICRRQYVMSWFEHGRAPAIVRTGGVRGGVIVDGVAGCRVDPDRVR